LQEGIEYILTRTESGQLPQEFFRTESMKRYIGSANGERGLEFGEATADELREHGWTVRTEVAMSEFGGGAELGDVDVLAWKNSGEVLIIECKRLQLAKTVAEVAEICRRFKGEAKDELAKHIRRVNWLRDNVDAVRDVIGPHTGHVR